MDHIEFFSFLINVFEVYFISLMVLYRLLQQGSCAFARLYSAFHETLFAAKLYLTAALNNPIMGLLMMEEKYLDIEPEKKVAER